METDNLIIFLQGKIRELELDIQYNLHQHNMLQEKYDLLKSQISKIKTEINYLQMD
jgi:hypothetical protein